MKLTIDGRRLFPGAELFNLKATHGMPLDFCVDEIINVAGIAVEWPGFIDAARSNGWWDFQTYKATQHALDKAGLPGPMQRGILLGMQKYMMAHAHPLMQEDQRG